MITLLLFRAQSLGQFQKVFYAVFVNFQVAPEHFVMIRRMLFFIIPLLVIQVGQWIKKDLLFVFHRHWLVKTFIYAVMAYLLNGWGLMAAEEFIYFQF